MKRDVSGGTTRTFISRKQFALLKQPTVSLLLELIEDHQTQPEFVHKNCIITENIKSNEKAKMYFNQWRVKHSYVRLYLTAFKMFLVI